MMTKLVRADSELVADHFVNYLFDDYRGTRHVRRVASWVGLIVLGVQRAVGKNWKIPRNRQLRFEFQGRAFKAKYNHKAGKRGGIEIIEILPGPGSPAGKTIASIRNLQEAESFYNRAPLLFSEFVARN